MGDQSKHQPQPELHPDHFAPRRRGAWPGWFLWPTMLLLLYILSIGPAMRFAVFGQIPFPIYRTLYYPIDRLYWTCPPAHQCLDWYFSAVWHVPLVNT
jgi:hypothetical protein